MKFIDLNTQYERIKPQILGNIEKVLDEGNYILGHQVYELEKQLADYAGRKYCTSCSNGTDALLMPLMAMNIGAGDAVFTCPFTFFATAEVISMLGATPVFVDIDPQTFNIDPNLLEEEIKKVINKGELTPKAIIPVDLFGYLADYSSLEVIAERYNLTIIEDAAQSFGASYERRKSCSFGKVAATSFYPAKPLGCYGDGGAIFTDDEEMHKLLVSIRVHGQGSDKYNNQRIGINGRLDTLQAVILIEKLKLLDEEIDLRNNVAAKYNELIKSVETPKISEGNISAWAQYSVLAKSSQHRNELMNKLKENGIPSVIYYPVPLHLQDAFKYLNYSKGDFKYSEDVASRIFSLPMHPYLKNEEIERIAYILNS